MRLQLEEIKNKSSDVENQVSDMQIFEEILKEIAGIVSKK